MSTIFNKNHITIIKLTPKCKTKDIRLRIDFIRDYGARTVFYHNKKETVKVKKKSKLGFWYWSEQTTHNDKPEYSINKVILCLRNSSYELTYPYKSEHQYICVDTRPWDIVPGDAQFDEHYMHDLENDVNDMLNDILECTGTIEYTNRYYNSLDRPVVNEVKPEIIYKELKTLLFTDLFGNKNGIRFQTDSEKLLSHGFDIKMSFRKRKEE